MDVRLFSISGEIFMRSNVRFSRYSVVALLIAVAFLAVGGTRWGSTSIAAQFQGITLPATAMHIHKGVRGQNGPVVVPFSPVPDANGNAQGCVAVKDNALLMDILTHPSNYYFNVHNADFPNGAMRGQLEP